MKDPKKYLITLAVGFSVVALIVFTKDIFAQTEAQKIFHILTDAFFAAGTFITAAGLLVWSSNEGTFDMLVYGVKSFVNMFKKNPEKKYEDFFDYRQSRADSKFSFGYLIICGLFFLAVSFVMLFLYGRYN